MTKSRERSNRLVRGSKRHVTMACSHAGLAVKDDRLCVSLNSRLENNKEEEHSGFRAEGSQLMGSGPRGRSVTPTYPARLYRDN